MLRNPRMLPWSNASALLAVIPALAILAFSIDVAAQQAPASAASSATDANAATLFPNGGVTPAPELEENRRGGSGRQGTGQRGQRGRATRANDVLSSRAANDPLTVRIAFRKAKTEAMLRHPQIALLEREADQARSDVEKRAYLSSYYTELYSAINKIDPSPEMASHVRILTKIAKQRYDPQRRVVGGEEDLVRGAGGGRGRRR